MGAKRCVALTFCRSVILCGIVFTETEKFTHNHLFDISGA